MNTREQKSPHEFSKVIVFNGHLMCGDCSTKIREGGVSLPSQCVKCGKDLDYSEVIWEDVRT